MKLCRFHLLESSARSTDSVAASMGKALSGVLEDGVISEIDGELWGARERTGQKWPLDRVKLLPPSAPTKLVCVGKNYRDHAKEMGGEPPKEPLIFLKPPSTIIAPEDSIVLPRISNRVEYEGELAVVIGKRCFLLGPDEDSRPYILGYTCVNDVTARDFQNKDGQWWRAKGCDTFCPFGPFLETDHPTSETMIETFQNGVKKQSGRVGEMIFSIDAIIHWITQAMTLYPGDVIPTGTPAGVGPLAPGDVLEVKISGVGTLRNPVIGPR